MSITSTAVLLTVFFNRFSEIWSTDFKIVGTIFVVFDKPDVLVKTYQNHLSDHRQIHQILRVGFAEHMMARFQVDDRQFDNSY